MVDITSFTYDLLVPYTHEDWRGRIRASAGVGGSLDEKTVLQFDGEFKTLLVQNYPQEILQIPHRIFALVAHAL